MAEVLKERYCVCNETDDNWDYGIEQCHKKILEILLVDIDACREYLLNECTDEEFFLVSEVFEDLIQKTQKAELIEVFRSRLDKVVPENYNQKNFSTKLMKEYIDYEKYVKNVKMDIDYAEGWLNE